MSNLISNQIPSPAGSAVATFPPDMGTMGVPPIMSFSPTEFTAPTSLTSSVTHPLLSVRWTHRRPRSFEEAEQFGEASSIHKERSQTGNASFSYYNRNFESFFGCCEIELLNYLVFQVGS
ncbi:unnamed protein product [Malus baccata var. baccata]